MMHGTMNIKNSINQSNMFLWTHWLLALHVIIPLKPRAHLAQSELPHGMEINANSMPTGLQLETSWREAENEYRILATISSVKQFTALVYLVANKYHIQGISLIQCSASYVRLPLKRYQRSVQCVPNQDGTKIALRDEEDVSRRCKTWHYTCVNPHSEHKFCLCTVLKFNLYITENTLHFHYNNSYLILWREIIAFYFKNHTKQIKTKCAKKKEKFYS